jgi:hypothetical protein
MAKLMSKSELIQQIAEQHANNMTRKDVKGVIETLAEIGHKELKKTGAFFVPGFACEWRSGQIPNTATGVGHPEDWGSP